MKKRLTEEQIKHAVGKCARGRRPSEVAAGAGVSTRHAQRLYAEFRATGTVHVRRRPGRIAPCLPTEFAPECMITPTLWPP